jgi:hypothetical protein
MARLTSYTVHLPPPKPGRDADTAIEFVPDSFSWLAFLVPWAWFLWNRMWLTTFLYVLGLVLVAVALWATGFPSLVQTGILFALSLLVGLEATNLKRRTLRRRGFHENGVVVAPTREDAERRYFAERASARAPMPTTLGGPPSAAPAHFGATPSVIGLFPEADPSARGAR